MLGLRGAESPVGTESPGASTTDKRHQRARLKIRQGTLCDVIEATRVMSPGAGLAVRFVNDLSTYFVKISSEIL